MDVRPAPAPYGQQPLAPASTAGSYYSAHQNMQASRPQPAAVPMQQQPIAPMYHVDQARHGHHMSPTHPYASNVPPIAMPGTQQGHGNSAQQQQPQHPLSMVSVKGKRKRASPQQLQVLNRIFAETSFPSTETRNRLAQELQMTPRTVQIWFQNKRQAARMRDHSGNGGPRLSSHIKSHVGTKMSMSPMPTSSRRMSTSSHSAGSSSSPVTSGGGLNVVAAAAAVSSASASSSSTTSMGQDKNSASPAWSEDSGAAMKVAPGYLVSSAPTVLSTSPPPPQQPITPTSATYAQQPAIMAPPPPMPHSAEPMVLSRKPEIPAMVTTYSSDHLIPSAARSSSFISNDRGFSSQLLHTRHDPWFANDRSMGKMGYLYSNNSGSSQALFMRSKSDCNNTGTSVLPQLQQHSAQRSYSLMPPTMHISTSPSFSATSKSAGMVPGRGNSALTPPDAVPVQRSMSLLAMLDAPPEQRTLPPLPTRPHLP